MARKGPYKVKVTIGDSVVEVEGEEKGVVSIVQALGDVVRAGRKVSSSLPTPKSSVLGPSARSGHVDIRTFFSEKKPSSDVEATAAAAYYYKYLAPPDQRRDGIDPHFLQEAFRLARRPLPSKTAYTLSNTRNAGYVDSTSETGVYRLNPVGFNLVEHTLGKAEATAEKKRPRKKKSTTKNKTRKKRAKR